MTDTQATHTPELMTPQEVADWLRLSVDTLENHRIRGTGPKFVKLGNQRRSPVRYRRADVEAWMFDSERQEVER